IHIYHNTIIDSEEIILGSNGNTPPTNVVIANNVFANPRDQLFVQATENETWITNLSFGSLGIDTPVTGISSVDPLLDKNAEGFFQPNANSPLIASSEIGYPAVPLYPGMEYDNEISLDLMKESRPQAITDRAIGASEFSSSVNVQPHATEMNTGPSYLFDNPIDYVAANVLQLFIGEEKEIRSIRVSSNINWTVTSSEDWVSTDLSSGSGDAKLNITIAANPDSLSRSASLTITGGTESATIIINQDPGEGPIIEDSVVVGELMIFPNPTNGNLIFDNIPEEFYSASIEILKLNGSSVFSEEYIIRDNELVIDLDKLASAMYIMKVKFVTQDGTFQTEMTHKLVRN
ncbi:MAG: BACON domain-containing carbohydrate-binding protein, partial [Bacteroidota bacterium]